MMIKFPESFFLNPITDPIKVIMQHHEKIGFVFQLVLSVLNKILHIYFLINGTSVILGRYFKPFVFYTMVLYSVVFEEASEHLDLHILIQKHPQKWVFKAD